MLRIAPKVVSLVLVTGAIAYFLLRQPVGTAPPGTAGEGDAETQTLPLEVVPQPAAPPPAVVKEAGVALPAAAPATAAPAGAGARDDVVTMQALRELLNTEPLRAIELARQANRRAPDSPDAPERGWIVVKALAGLKRFHEARDAAADLASKYPDSSWAMDAKRHMLVNPLDLPSREEQQRQDQQRRQ